jgi:hypothetical protein
MSTKLPPGTLDRLWSDPNNWRSHVFYVCPEDPRLLVPKRQKWRGWTINFGRPHAVLFLTLFMIVTIVPLLLLAALGLMLLLPVAIGIVLLVACVAGIYYSSPARYEDKP